MPRLDVYLLYGHLSQVSVATGQRVAPGDLVGAVGMTGIAIGPHLHVEMRLGANTSRQKSVGPTPAQTPYEHARQVTAALPETAPYVQEITDTYVQFRFSRHAATPPDAAPVDAGLNAAWRKLEPLFWHAWWQRLRQRVFGRKKVAINPYDLVERPKN